MTSVIPFLESAWRMYISLLLSFGLAFSKYFYAAYCLTKPLFSLCKMFFKLCTVYALFFKSSLVRLKESVDTWSCVSLENSLTIGALLKVGIIYAFPCNFIWNWFLFGSGTPWSFRIFDIPKNSIGSVSPLLIRTKFPMIVTVLSSLSFKVTGTSVYYLNESVICLELPFIAKLDGLQYQPSIQAP